MEDENAALLDPQDGDLSEDAMSALEDGFHLDEEGEVEGY